MCLTTRQQEIGAARRYRALFALARSPGFIERVGMRTGRSMLSICAAILHAVLAGTALAQPGSISGVVEDSLGAHLDAVQVAVVGTSRAVVSDSRGHFRIAGLRPATYELRVRRLGYAPVTAQAVVRSSDTVSLFIELRALAVGIAPIVVSDSYLSPKLTASGFNRRRTGSTVPAAQFITRDEIERRHPFALSQLLLRMSTGTKSCSDATIFVDGTVQPPPRDPPLVVLTAREAARIGPAAPRPNPLDQIPPAWVEGMEVYVGLAQIPAEFKSPGRSARCVIAIWTR